MSKIFDERLIADEATKDSIIYDEHLIRYKLAGEFVKGKKILDIACGSGYGAKILADFGAEEVTAVDIDKDVIQKAKKNFPKENIKYTVGDCLDTGFENKKFDIIVSFETIEHLKNQDKYLEEMKRIVKDDGLVVISTPNREIFGNKNPYHTREFTREEFEGIIKKYFPYVRILEQRNALASCIQVDDSKEAKMNFGKETKPWYYIAVCSNAEITDKLPQKNYVSVNYNALEKMNDNPGFKLANKVYSALVRVPGVKKIFEKIKK